MSLATSGWQLSEFFKTVENAPSSDFCVEFLENRLREDRDILHACRRQSAPEKRRI